MSVVIWCDLAPGIGAGHLMRCVALAEELLARGRTVRFLADAASVPFARAELERRGLAWETPPATQDEQLAAVASQRPEAVVLDSYLLPREVYAALRASCRVLAFVDAGIDGREADVYLDPTLGAVDPEPTALPVPDARRLFGIRHALLRDDVLRHRPLDPDRHVETEVLRVLAFAGGTDAHGAAPAMLTALAGTREPLAATVVAAGPERADQLRAVPLAGGQSLEVVAPTDRLPALVRAADVVVSAAGTSSAELLCLGAATALVQVADNQADTYARMVESDLVAPLGRLRELRTDTSAASAVLSGLLGNGAAQRDRRRTLRRAGWELVDGLGRSRVADHL